MHDNYKTKTEYKTYLKFIKKIIDFYKLNQYVLELYNLLLFRDYIKKKL